MDDKLHQESVLIKKEMDEALERLLAKPGTRVLALLVQKYLLHLYQHKNTFVPVQHILLYQ